jgi:ElaB/YqjD/DUF883 family membrane-anchored ribosome-binding protein
MMFEKRRQVMGVKDRFEELKKKVLDKDTQKRVKAEIDKGLKKAKEAIDKVEKELKDPENQARVENSVRDAKAKLNKLKLEFKVNKARAVTFTKAHPEKALAAAAAAGALAGVILAALKRKR